MATVSPCGRWGPGFEGNRVFRDKDGTVLGPYHHGNAAKKREIGV